MYRYYNANSHNNFINDCVIRMTAVIEDIPYSQAYMQLSKLAMQEGLMLDDSRFVKHLLDKKYKRIPYKEKTIGEFAENHPIGRYILTTKGHIVACIDGFVVDTWDSTKRQIEYVWKVDKNN